MAILNPDQTKRHITFRTLKTDAQLEKEKIDELMKSHDLSRGQAKGILHDLAGIPDEANRNLSKLQIADKWGLASKQVLEMDEALKGDYRALRSNGSNKCLILGALMAHELLERMIDPKKRALIPADKLPKMMKDSMDAAVLLQDGHQPAVNVDISGLVNSVKRVEDLKRALKGK